MSDTTEFVQLYKRLMDMATKIGKMCKEGKINDPEACAVAHLLLTAAQVPC